MQTAGDTVTVGVTVGVFVRVGVGEFEISGGEHGPINAISTFVDGYITESEHAQMFVISFGPNV